MGGAPDRSRKTPASTSTAAGLVLLEQRAALELPVKQALPELQAALAPLELA